MDLLLQGAPRLAICLAFMLVSALSRAGAAEDPPPPLTYADARTAVKTFELHDGRRVEVDVGTSWRGTTVYLGLAGDLVAVDDATGAVRWSRPVSPAWRVLAFCSDHPPKGGTSAESETTERALVAVRCAGDTTGTGDAECYELEHGHQCAGPSTPSGEAIPSRVLDGGGWGACATRFAVIATTAEQFARVVERLHGVDDADLGLQPLQVPWDGLARPESAIAKVDFNREVVLAVCYGDTGNTSGIMCDDARSDDVRTLVRLSTPGFQTSGGSIPARPWILIALPRREDGAYAIAWDDHMYIGDPPLWHEQERIPARADPAHALDRMPPRAAQTPVPSLPGGFAREVHHSGVVVSDNIPKPGERLVGRLETSRYDGEPFPKRWWGDAPYFREWRATLAVDWYALPDGVAVPHGDYRIESRGAVFQGRFVDGARDGEWRVVDGRRSTGREAFVTYRRGQLHGPVRILKSVDGAIDCSGQFDSGTADGVWRWFDANGAITDEQTFDHGVWNGACTSHRSGVKESFTCVHGQLDGDYRRYHADGTLAASGGWIAGQAPLSRDGFGRGWGIAAVSTPGRRHGDWVRYALDGHELWRGRFDRGTGILVEFRDNGERWFSASFDGGRLVSLDEFRADGSVMFRETAVGEGETAIAYLDAEGNEVFTGIWRRERPWSGSCADQGGRFRTYVDGKPQSGPPGMIREAAAALERQLALVALRRHRGMNPDLPPASTTDADRDADRAVDAALARATGAQPADAADAVAGLRVLGAAAAVELGARLDDADPAVRSACAAALDAIPAAAGKPAEGITIGAIQVGPRSQPGDAVSLLVTITNTTDHELCIFQHIWQLFLLKPGHENFPHWMDFDAVPDLTPADFLRILPGASYRFVMDAEPNEDVRGLETAQVALTFPEPENAESMAPVAMVHGREWMISGPIRITYADERLDPRGLELVQALVKDEARLGAATGLIAMGRDALPALRRGLRSGDADVRAACAAFISGADGFQPSEEARLDASVAEELRGDLIAWWRRWGHRQRDQTWDRLVGYAATLPADTRAAFQARLLERHPVPWDHRSVIP